MHVFFSLICCYRDPTKSLKMGTGKTSLLLYSNILLWEMRKKIVFKMRYWASQVVLVVKNPPENAEDMRDAGAVPGSRRSHGGGHGNHSSILAWRIPWTEEPGRL